MPSVMPRSATVHPTATAGRDSASVRTAAVVLAHATTPSVSDASAREIANAPTNVSADQLI